MMITVAMSALLLQGALQMTPQAIPSPHFDVSAAYEAPARKGAAGHIVFEFKKKDPDVNINEDPAPRIKFASGSPLVAPPPPKSSGDIPDLANARYIDLSKPLLLPVTVVPGAAKGLSMAKTTLSYFYCSKRENWCRRGTADFDLAVALP
jgi:hypothetical protein